jgi:hypothetical protein
MRTVALVCFALLLGCSINNRSQGFECGPTTPCDTGRVCESGFCVVAGSGSGSNVPGDAPRNSPDAPRNGNDGGQMCPAQCTTCDPTGKTCDINCEQAGSACAQNITCPEGYTCTIECTTQGSCRQNIDCTKGNACTITCSVGESCAHVACGSGACDVMCNGTKSCGNVD